MPQRRRRIDERSGGEVNMSPGRGIGVGWDHGQGQSVTDGMGSPQVTDDSGHRHAITLRNEAKRGFSAWEPMAAWLSGHRIYLN